MDVLRGVALLGILTVNIVGFAWPDEVASAPLLDPDAGALDVALWMVEHSLFDTKMMTIFAMLFGAGIVLMSDRAEDRAVRLVGLHYRRMFWLLVIGLIHAYLIWSGDILVPYAVCGFLLYPFRKMRPRTLIFIGLALNVMYIPLFLGVGEYLVPILRETATHARAKLDAAKPLEEWERVAIDGWEKLVGTESGEDFAKEIVEHRSGYSKIVRRRAEELIGVHLLGIPCFMIAWFGGRMLMGMGLMKLGFFSARCSKPYYLAMMLLGYGIGLPLMAVDIHERIKHGFFLGRGLLALLEGWEFLLLLGSLPVVFGHVGAVMLIYRSRALPRLTRRLAAVGRMALSNYLFDSIVFTSIFDGYGLGLYAKIHRPMLHALVLAVWTFQLWVSPLWLGAFRYGPAEWLWRSLTYGKRLPLRLRSS